MDGKRSKKRCFLPMTNCRKSNVVSLTRGEFLDEDPFFFGFLKSAIMFPLSVYLADAG